MPRPLSINRPLEPETLDVIHLLVQAAAAATRGEHEEARDIYRVAAEAAYSLERVCERRMESEADHLASIRSGDYDRERERHG